MRFRDQSHREHLIPDYVAQRIGVKKHHIDEKLEERNSDKRWVASDFADICCAFAYRLFITDGRQPSQHRMKHLYWKYDGVKSRYTYYCYPYFYREKRGYTDDYHPHFYCEKYDFKYLAELEVVQQFPRLCEFINSL